MASLGKYLLAGMVLLLVSHSPAMASEQGEDISLSAVQMLIEQEKHADAFALLQQLVKKEPDNYQAWFFLGAEQAKRNLFQDAVTSFHKVIALQPELAEPHNNLAVIYNELGDLRSAVTELEASLKLNPDYATAFENIGDLYVKLAAESYKNALAKSPDKLLRKRYEYLLHIRDIDTVSQLDVAKMKETTAAFSAKNKAGILQSIEAWRDAWSKRDARAYIAAYDPDFKQDSRFVSHNDWVEYRLQRIIEKAFIDISLEHIQIIQMPGDIAETTFLQHYKSDTYASDDRKKIKLKKVTSGWKIIYEKSL